MISGNATIQPQFGRFRLPPGVTDEQVIGRVAGTPDLGQEGRHARVRIVGDTATVQGWQDIAKPSAPGLPPLAVRDNELEARLLEQLRSANHPPLIQGAPESDTFQGMTGNSYRRIP
ncbi:MAG: hypothetical protein AB7P76_00800 [Candidatus Melainabacteria bacterium]